MHWMKPALMCMFGITMCACLVTLEQSRVTLITFLFYQSYFGCHSSLIEFAVVGDFFCKYRYTAGQNRSVVD